MHASVRGGEPGGGGLEQRRLGLGVVLQRLGDQFRLAAREIAGANCGVGSGQALEIGRGADERARLGRGGAECARREARSVAIVAARVGGGLLDAERGLGEQRVAEPADRAELLDHAHGLGAADGRGFEVAGEPLESVGHGRQFGGHVFVRLHDGSDTTKKKSNKIKSFLRTMSRARHTRTITRTSDPCQSPSVAGRLGKAGNRTKSWS